MKPYSEASARNSAAIFARLAPLLQPCRRVLEIGSGSGQHAVYFGSRLPHLVWITSDLAENHDGIESWLREADLDNVRAPVQLDVRAQNWPLKDLDAVFTANTAHIMSEATVAAMVQGIGRALAAGGIFVIYGPFSYSGQHTSESNQRFDDMLRSTAAHMGVRDFDWLRGLLAEQGLQLQADHSMPANNRLLVWRASAEESGEDLR